MCKSMLLIESFSKLGFVCLTPVINGVKREHDAMYAYDMRDMQEMIDLFHINPLACIFAYKSRMCDYESEVSR